MNFGNKGTRDLFNGNDTPAARRLIPANIKEDTLAELTAVYYAETLKELTVPPRRRLEKLKGDRKGQWSIRIDNQYRICFTWTDQEGADNLEVTDYH